MYMHPSTDMFSKFSNTNFSFPLVLDVFKNYLRRKEQNSQGFIIVFMSKVTVTENV